MSQEKNCAADADKELSLPNGFCATIFADKVGHARQLAVAPDGTVYVNTWSGVYYGNDTPPAGGFLIALKDTKGTGHADVNVRFGPTVAEGAHGGTGIVLYKNWLYAEIDDRIVRYALKEGETAPSAKPETILSGMPLNGDHPMHPFAIDAQGNLLVSMGAATNACEVQNRMPHSPATTLAPSSRLAPASGATTPISLIRSFRPKNATPPASATARVSTSTPQAACTSPNTAAISCTRIGPNSIRRSKVQSFPRSAC